MPRARVFALALLSALLAFGLPAPRPPKSSMARSSSKSVTDRGGRARRRCDDHADGDELDTDRDANETGTATFSTVPLGTFSVRTAFPASRNRSRPMSG